MREIMEVVRLVISGDKFVSVQEKEKINESVVVKQENKKETVKKFSYVEKNFVKEEQEKTPVSNESQKRKLIKKKIKEKKEKKWKEILTGFINAVQESQLNAAAKKRIQSFKAIEHQQFYILLFLLFQELRLCYENETDTNALLTCISGKLSVPIFTVNNNGQEKIKKILSLLAKKKIESVEDKECKEKINLQIENALDVKEYKNTPLRLARNLYNLLRQKTFKELVILAKKEQETEKKKGIKTREFCYDIDEMIKDAIALIIQFPENKQQVIDLEIKLDWLLRVLEGMSGQTGVKFIRDTVQETYQFLLSKLSEEEKKKVEQGNKIALNKLLIEKLKQDLTGISTFTWTKKVKESKETLIKAHDPEKQLTNEEVLKLVKAYKIAYEDATWNYTWYRPLLIENLDLLVAVVVLDGSHFDFATALEIFSLLPEKCGSKIELMNYLKNNYDEQTPELKAKLLEVIIAQEEKLKTVDPFVKEKFADLLVKVTNKIIGRKKELMENKEAIKIREKKIESLTGSKVEKIKEEVEKKKEEVEKINEEVEKINEEVEKKKEEVEKINEKEENPKEEKEKNNNSKQIETLKQEIEKLIEKQKTMQSELEKSEKIKKSLVKLAHQHNKVVNDRSEKRKWLDKVTFTTDQQVDVEAFNIIGENEEQKKVRQKAETLSVADAVVAEQMRKKIEEYEEEVEEEIENLVVKEEEFEKNVCSQEQFGQLTLEEQVKLLEKKFTKLSETLQEQLTPIINDYNKKKAIIKQKDEILENEKLSPVYCGILSQLSQCLLAAKAVSSGQIDLKNAKEKTVKGNLFIQAGKLFSFPIISGILEGIGEGILTHDKFNRFFQHETRGEIALTYTAAEKIAELIARKVVLRYSAQIEKLDEEQAKAFAKGTYIKIAALLAAGKVKQLHSTASDEQESYARIADQILYHLAQPFEDNYDFFDGLLDDFEGKSRNIDHKEWGNITAEDILTKTSLRLNGKIYKSKHDTNISNVESKFGNRPATQAEINGLWQVGVVNGNQNSKSTSNETSHNKEQSESKMPFGGMATPFLHAGMEERLRNVEIQLEQNSEVQKELTNYQEQVYEELKLQNKELEEEKEDLKEENKKIKKELEKIWESQFKLEEKNNYSNQRGEENKQEKKEDENFGETKKESVELTEKEINSSSVEKTPPPQKKPIIKFKIKEKQEFEFILLKIPDVNYPERIKRKYIVACAKQVQDSHINNLIEQQNKEETQNKKKYIDRYATHEKKPLLIVIGAECYVYIFDKKWDIKLFKKNIDEKNVDEKNVESLFSKEVGNNPIKQVVLKNEFLSEIDSEVEIFFEKNHDQNALRNFTLMMLACRELIETLQNFQKDMSAFVQCIFPVCAQKLKGEAQQFFQKVLKPNFDLFARLGVGTLFDFLWEKWVRVFTTNDGLNEFINYLTTIFTGDSFLNYMKDVEKATHIKKELAMVEWDPKNEIKMDEKTNPFLSKLKKIFTFGLVSDNQTEELESKKDESPLGEKNFAEYMESTLQKPVQFLGRLPLLIQEINKSFSRITEKSGSLNLNKEKFEQKNDVGLESLLVSIKSLVSNINSSVSHNKYQYTSDIQLVSTNNIASFFSSSSPSSLNKSLRRSRIINNYDFNLLSEENPVCKKSFDQKEEKTEFSKENN